MKKYIVLILLLSVLIVISWFISARQIVTGEEGFSIFNNISIGDQVSLWQSSGTGYVVPYYLTRLLPLVFVSVVRLVVPMFLIQAIFYFFIFLTGFTGMFLLARIFLQSNTFINRTAFIAALFYFFNLYTLSQVFNRFLYASMFLWSYLPWFLLLWIEWISKARIRYLIIFLLSSLIFSLAYSQPAHVLTLWVPAFIFSLAALIKKEWGDRIKILSFTILGVLLWLVINSWWLYPYVKLGGTSIEGSSQFNQWEANFDSLTGVSKYFPIQEILLLKQSYLFGENSFWYPFYSNPWIIFISLLAILIALLGWFIAKKESCRNYLTILAFVGLFISKGTNPPLGYELFHWLFEHVPQTMVLRNSYEKFGLVWLLPYAIFFSFGINYFYQKFNLRLRNLLAILIIFFVFVILVLPMWTGSLYTESIRIKVPQYYEEANQFLNLDKTDGRILMLPIIPGDGVRYDWSFGGVEPSEFLFNRPAISRILRTKYFDDKYMDLYNMFINDKDYNQLLTEMNIKYLVLHYDMDVKSVGASASAEVAINLEKNPNIKLLKNFSKLAIYEFTLNKEGKLFTAEGEVVPAINYEKLGTTYYKVNIKNSVQPFDLIFKSTFNDFWEARIEGEKIGNHFLVYNYANGWRINKTGDYIIDVVFKVWPWE